VSLGLVDQIRANHATDIFDMPISRNSRLVFLATQGAKAQPPAAGDEGLQRVRRCRGSASQAKRNEKENQPLVFETIPPALPTLRVLEYRASWPRRASTRRSEFFYGLTVGHQGAVGKLWAKPDHAET